MILSITMNNKKGHQNDVLFKTLDCEFSSNLDFELTCHSMKFGQKELDTNNTFCRIFETFFWIHLCFFLQLMKKYKYKKERK